MKQLLIKIPHGCNQKLAEAMMVSIQFVNQALTFKKHSYTARLIRVMAMNNYHGEILIITNY